MHDRLLARLGLTPQSLRASVTNAAAVDWVVTRLPLLAALPIAALGLVLFWVPRELTGRLGERLALPEGEDTVPTYRVIGGAVIFPAWFLLLAVGAGLLWGMWPGVLTFFLLPIVAVAALSVGETRQLSWHAIRRFMILRTQRDRIAQLRVRQRRIAEQLRDLLDASTRADSSPGSTGTPPTTSPTA